MRTLMLLLAVLVLPMPAHGQDRARLDTLPLEALPRDVAREATDIYNRPETLRSTERLEIDSTRTVTGDVAVLNGPVIVAGHVTGRLLAINSDVVLRRGSRIDGDLMVIGGEVEGRDSAAIGGEIRVYRQRLRYDQEGDRIVATRDTAEAESWWQRWERRRQHRESVSRIIVASAGAYNRTEGLPVDLGPSWRRRMPWGSARVDAFAVLRTETSFRNDSNDVGHDLHGELRLGRRTGVAVRGRLYSVVNPVEGWQLSDLEAGLGTFVVRRDYRDYYSRHGGATGVELFREGLGDLSLSYAHERWGSRADSNPWTLFRHEVDFRPNPAMDAGRMHLVTGGGTLDTRNDRDNPAYGWFVHADVERGSGQLDQLAPAAPGARQATALGPVHYTRGFLDARRYNRLSPNAQLNFRVVAGGWLGGDELPLERRLSVDGPGAMPGYGFRVARASEDRGTCGLALMGMPAQCDRILLGQVEYRGDVHFAGMGWLDDGVRVRFQNAPVWVLFADAGRGWLVREGSQGAGFSSGELPALNSFRTDIGAGIDFGSAGLYVAKAMSDRGEPARVFVRLRHRF